MRNNINLTELGHDLNVAKIGVLCKYGFSVEEIARVTDLSIFIVEKIIKENNFKQESE